MMIEIASSVAMKLACCIFSSMLSTVAADVPCTHITNTKISSFDEKCR